MLRRWFSKKAKEDKPKEVGLKPINYPPQVILLWTKAVEGDKTVQLWLKENGYVELFHATNAIFLVQESRDWLMNHGFAHLMAMINAAEGLESAQHWLMENRFDLLFHLGRAIDHNEESWLWLKQFSTPDIFMLAKSVQFVKDQIEENHGDIHSYGKDL